MTRRGLYISDTTQRPWGNQGPRRPSSSMDTQEEEASSASASAVNFHPQQPGMVDESLEEEENEEEEEEEAERNGIGDTLSSSSSTLAMVHQHHHHQHHQQPTLTTIPPELLLQILAHLSSTIDLLNMALTSRNLLLPSLSLLYASPTIPTITTFTSLLSTITSSSLPYGSMIKRLDLRDITDHIDPHHHLARLGTQNVRFLERLFLPSQNASHQDSHTTATADPTTSFILTNLPTLRTLSTPSLPSSTLNLLTQPHQLQQTFPSLTKLAIPSTTSLTNSTLTLLASIFPSLKKLDVSHCPSITSTGINAFFTSKRALSEIGLSGTECEVATFLEWIGKGVREVKAQQVRF
ncbi:hypothetical protein HDU97_005443, partial [Phlyctochytrium planicorne]